MAWHRTTGLSSPSGLLREHFPLSPQRHYLVWFAMLRNNNSRDCIYLGVLAAHQSRWLGSGSTLPPVWVHMRGNRVGVRWVLSAQIPRFVLGRKISCGASLLDIHLSTLFNLFRFFHFMCRKYGGGGGLASGNVFNYFS